MSTKQVLIVRNDAHEGAGLLGTLLVERGIEQHTVFGSDIEDLRQDRFSALVILGGAQSAYQTEEYPYLNQEMSLAKTFLACGKPIAGFCLGAQLLARTLGGEVAPGKQKEIGWYDLAFNEAAANDGLIGDLPKTLRAYHFHGDLILPIPGCTNLASSAITEWQLFRCGSNVYGFQYHAEADRLLIEVMCGNNADYLASNGFSREDIIQECQTYSPAFERHSRMILNRWVDLFAKI